MKSGHKPVLLKEVIEIFDPQPGQTYIDATVGEGGHAKEVLKRITPRGVFMGLDWDPNVLVKVKSELSSYAEKNRIILQTANYTNLGELAEKNNLGKVDGILFDLGFGTHTLELSGRGFSFLKDEPLDMRYSPETGSVTAADVLNKFSEQELEKIFRECGEERFSRRIAKDVILARSKQKFETTSQLVRVIGKSIPTRFPKQKIHLATRVFQALRIFVNQELNNLKIALPQTTKILKPGGKIMVISFHSLEERIIKNFFKENKREGILEIITSKPTRPTAEEIGVNPGARSARLRAARFLTPKF